MWVISPEQHAISRVEGGRIVRRIPIPEGTLPVLMSRGGALWVAREQRLGHYGLERIDADTGTRTQTVDLGLHRPTALLAAPAGLWVVAGDGAAVLVGTKDQRSVTRPISPSSRRRRSSTVAGIRTRCG